jgi:hypothetical protein
LANLDGSFYKYKHPQMLCLHHQFGENRDSYLSTELHHHCQGPLPTLNKIKLVITELTYTLLNVKANFDTTNEQGLK